jgi:RNA polymerase sigma-70 factor (ECF subfamily)
MIVSPTEDPKARYERALADLTARLLTGQSQVLEDVLRMLGPRTERLIRGRLRHALSEADYEDAISIALFRLWERRDRFDSSRAKLDRWFYVLARNAAIDLLRRRAVHHEEPVDDLDRLPAASREAGLRSDSPLRRDLARALTRVSEMDKRILLSGLTETQLSLELGLKPGAIRVRRRRAKEKLRTVLREMGHVA